MEPKDPSKFIFNTTGENLPPSNEVSTPLKTKGYSLNDAVSSTDLNQIVKEIVSNRDILIEFIAYYKLFVTKTEDYLDDHSSEKLAVKYGVLMDYSPLYTYNKGNKVFFSSLKYNYKMIYECLEDVTKNIDPDSDITKWILIA